jgi:transketolase
MRDEFIQTLSELAEHDERIMLVTGDLGFNVFNDYIKEHPRQFLNAGIAEQSMAGLATGLAQEGHIVFLYSIANFTFMRCLEQLRNGAAYHDCNVNVVSVGAGFSYGQLGITHHATEDLAIMRCMPTTMVACPAEHWEVGALTRATVETPGLTYMRLDKTCARSTHSEGENSLPIGKSRLLRTGSDISLVATGGILGEVLRAANELALQGVSAEVISVPFIKPFDASVVGNSAKKTGCVITVEEHSIHGGLGGMIAETLAELGVMPKVFRRIGLRERFTSVVGDQEYLRQRYGLSAEAIVAFVNRQLYKNRSAAAA